MRLLLVDDDPVFCDLATAVLAESGLTDLTLARSAEDALQIVDEQRIPFDCYLLDIMLDGMDGIELCSRLRQRVDCRVAPMIMITSAKAAPLMERAFAVGATDFLRKPLDETELVGRIRMAMQLVEVTKKERRRTSALMALSSYGSDIGQMTPEERLCFPDVASMLDYYELENRLLRMQSGHYQFSVFRVEIDNFTRFNRMTERRDVLQLLQTTGARISEAIPKQPLLLSHTGAGRFIGCIIGRQPDILPELEERLQLPVSESATKRDACAHDEASLVVTALSDRKIMSRDAAIALLRAEFEAGASAQADDRPEINTIEDEIFAKATDVERNIFAEN